MEIKTYNGNTAEPKPGEFVFYIQNKGKNSGRPLKNPIPNCWEFRSVRSVDWEILSLVFLSRILEPFIIGSVIPYIRLVDYKNIIFPILKNAIHNDGQVNAKYLQIREIEKQVLHREEVNNLLKQLKIATAHETIKNLKQKNAI